VSYVVNRFSDGFYPSGIGRLKETSLFSVFFGEPAGYAREAIEVVEERLDYGRRVMMGIVFYEGFGEGVGVSGIVGGNDVEARGLEGVFLSERCQKTGLKSFESVRSDG
jgi:hypothetical protein